MKAQELLSGPDKWTKCLNARSRDGNQVDPSDPEAVKWCLQGALIKCYPNEWEGKLMQINLFLAQKELESPVAWNDSPGRTFDEVRDLLYKLDL